MPLDALLLIPPADVVKVQKAPITDIQASVNSGVYLFSGQEPKQSPDLKPAINDSDVRLKRSIIQTIKTSLWYYDPISLEDIIIEKAENNKPDRIIIKLNIDQSRTEQLAKYLESRLGPYDIIIKKQT